MVPNLGILALNVASSWNRRFLHFVLPTLEIDVQFPMAWQGFHFESDYGTPEALTRWSPCRVAIES